MGFIHILIILEFLQIPSEYIDQFGIYKYLNPPDSIVWWQAGIVDLNSQKKLTFFCSDTIQKENLVTFSVDNTYTSNYYSSFLTNFFLVYKTRFGKIRYINKVEDVPSFVGTIDNLAEALFISSLYGFIAKSYMKYGSYCYQNGVYEFNLYKIIDPPDLIILDRKGHDKRQKSEPSRIRVNVNGDTFEINRKNDKLIKRLTVNDMYRPL